MQVIFLRALRTLLDPVDKAQPRREFEVEYATQKGEVVKGTIVCTSSHFQNDTLNFRFPQSGEVRTVNACLLLRVNGKEVML